MKNRRAMVESFEGEKSSLLIDGRTTWVPFRTPIKFVSNMRCHSSGSCVWTLPKSITPALFTRQSTGPYFATACSIVSFSLARSVTSTWAQMTFSGSFNASIRSRRRAMSSRGWPASENDRAQASPMPDEAPVMTTNGLEVVEDVEEAIVAGFLPSVEQMKNTPKQKKITTR